jgi:transposase-like protein
MSQDWEICDSQRDAPGVQSGVGLEAPSLIDFPITGLMDERACYDWLVDLLHPGGLACPRCGGADTWVHRFVRDPVLDYRCKGCGAVYNAFTGTDWHKTHFRPSQIVSTLRGFAQGRSTAGLARELGCSRGHLLGRRHRMQARALAAAEAGATPLPDGTVEADEAYQNSGEKRRLLADLHLFLTRLAVIVDLHSLASFGPHSMVRS